MFFYWRHQLLRLFASIFLLAFEILFYLSQRKKIRTKLSFVWTYKKLQIQPLEHSTCDFYVNTLGPYCITYNNLQIQPLEHSTGLFYVNTLGPYTTHSPLFYYLHDWTDGKTKTSILKRAPKKGKGHRTCANISNFPNLKDSTRHECTNKFP